MITSTRDAGGRDLLFTALHAGAARVVGALGDLYGHYNVATAKVIQVRAVARLGDRSSISTP